MSRLEIEGMLQRLRMERLELATRAAANISTIKHLLSLAAITPIEEIDIEGVHVMSEGLRKIKEQITENKEKQARLERELYS